MSIMYDLLPWSTRDHTPERFDTRLETLSFIYGKYGREASLKSFEAQERRINSFILGLRSGSFSHELYEDFRSPTVSLAEQRRRLRKASSTRSFDRVAAKIEALTADMSSRWAQDNETKLQLIFLLQDSATAQPRGYSPEQAQLRRELQNEILRLMDKGESVRPEEFLELRDLCYSFDDRLAKESDDEEESLFLKLARKLDVDLLLADF
jgi:hypothetical protein